MVNPKKSAEIIGRDVEIFLQTPLFSFRYRYDDQERDLLENTVRLSGTIIRESAAGLWLSVQAISNMKEVQKDLPFEEIFLPYAKIDFVVFL